MESRAFTMSLIPQQVAQGGALQLLNLATAGYQEFKQFLRTSIVNITFLCLLSSESHWKSCFKNKTSSWFENPTACVQVLF